MCQWFPLERVTPGEIIRGELRVELEFQASALSGSLIGQSQQQASSNQGQLQVQHDSKPSVRKKYTLGSPATSLQENLASVHTADIRDKNLKVDKKSESRSETSPVEENIETDIAFEKKPYLKRKPYKIRFHKLDWSKVGSKTNSNLKSSGNNTAAPNSAPMQPTIAKEKTSTHTRVDLSTQSLSDTTKISTPSNALEQLVCGGKATNQIKLELMQLKHKAELSAIFTSATKIPHLTKRQLSSLGQSKYGEKLCFYNAEYKTLLERFQLKR